RYGDMDYDWEQRVDTTSGTVSWRSRLLGTFHSAYQPTDPAAFWEMMAALPIEFEKFTFVDIGSGKGRTLLMASEYPFRKIIGVELIPELHRAAAENVARYQLRSHPAEAQRSGPPQDRAQPVTLGQRSSQQVRPIETLCMDARNFIFPETPLVVYLFNPLPEAALRQVMRNLEQSFERARRPVWLVYHNPVLEFMLMQSPAVLVKEVGKPEYSIFRMTSERGRASRP
ncbi:MAG: class I SAM-dependent methyltransferase, partial [Candidatus Sulfotelmatobacter sp.]